MHASVCLANIGAATRAGEFVHNRALEMFRGDLFHTKASFPLGGILRAERHFPPKLCSNMVERSSTFLVARKVSPTRKIPPNGNGLTEGIGAW